MLRGGQVLAIICTSCCSNHCTSHDELRCFWRGIEQAPSADYAPRPMQNQ
jgi:hypothetical protein